MRPFSSILAFFSLAAAGTAEVTPEQGEFFETKVRPVLAEHCYKCHGPEKQKAELRLDSRDALLKGTDLGPIVVPGKPEEGSFLQSIRHEGDSKMPEKEDKLPDEKIAALTEWVRMGLPWPDSGQPVKLSVQQAAAQKHWAFQPVRAVAPPTTADPEHWAKSEVDQFILAKLETAGLTPSPAAAKRTLLRRATFDLTGLPPTAAEVEAFEKDPAPDAFARVVDRLLASPHYGERWGRYWLDVARYADTKGYVFQEERRYGFAYTYRDWVIKAFNDDLPYDQFLVQQIAGDAVAPAGDARPLAALGFLTLGRRFINNQHDIIDDRIDVVTRGTMGLTVTCARCHDHKFELISQKDYYALYGVFASSQEPKELPLLPIENDPEVEAKYQAELAKLQEDIDRFLAGRGLKLSSLLSSAAPVPVTLPPLPREAIKGLLPRDDRDKSRELHNKIDALNAGPLAKPRAMALVDGNLVNPHVFKRGNPNMPGEAVPRRFLSLLAGPEPAPFKNGSGRLELAQAIASKENPLTARVMVNRVWMHHFGKGIVRTPGDFGVRGDAPTHPELLDFLAARFMERNWSVKDLHRAIMLSAAYQQGSDEQPKAALADPENRLLWRMNRRRLDFEATRDSLLTVAGQLDPAMGGRPVEITTQPFTRRRTVYSFIDRQNLPGVFRTFDFASPDTTNSQRFVTTVPQQALFMMNSPFVQEKARALVAAPPFQQAQAYEEQLQELYTRVFARRAEREEVDAGLQFVSLQLTRSEEAPSELSAWHYGFGSWNAAERKVHFQALPHFTKTAWQGGPKLPDAKLGWVMLDAEGGHAGNDAAHAAIRRWRAPRAGVVSIAGALRRSAAAGDGVIGRVVSSRVGELLTVEVGPEGNAETKLDQLAVEAGETLDFLVECRADNNSDTFAWAPIVRLESEQWDAKSQFAGPPPSKPEPLSAWAKYAQALLQTNEFVFVD